MAKNRHALILGIDLGGTKILTAVTNAQGKMLSRDHSVTRAKEGQQAVVNSILESIGRALEQAQITAADLTAIGLGAPGLSNPETGRCFSCLVNEHH
ncbi:ROK family protein [Chloroflexota bacterium]